MPTRREIALGRNLLINTLRLNKVIFAMSQILQGKDPITGQPSGASVSAIKGSIESLMIGTNLRLQMMTQFLSNYLGSVESSLSGWDETIEDFNSELSDFSTTKGAIESGMASLTSYQELADLGVSIEKPQRLKATGEPLFPPDVIGRLTIVNGLLDALRYELRGISETTGTPSGKSFDDKKKYARSGIQVANLELERIDTNENLPASFAISKEALDSDFDAMRDVIDYLANNIDLATTDKALAALADYIDAHVQKQPCIRRHWEWLQ